MLEYYERDDDRMRAALKAGGFVADRQSPSCCTCRVIL